MRRFALYILTSILTCAIGFGVANIFFQTSDLQVDIDRPQSLELTVQNEEVVKQKTYVFPDDNCGGWTDDVNYRPIIRKWISGAKLKDVPYCAETVIEATGFNPSTVHPMEIDVNGDGRNELALKSLCSATGNCAMLIYERVGKRARRIFTEVHGVQMYGIEGQRHFGYFDVWTKMHGSWNSGDRIVYRYNGRQYKPHACSYYEYEIDSNDKPADRPTLTPVPCSRMVDY